MRKAMLTLLLTCVVAGTAFAAGDGGMGLGNALSPEMRFAAKVVNFLVLLGVLHVFAKKPLANMMSNSAKASKELAEQKGIELEQAKKDLIDFKAEAVANEKALEERHEKSLAAIQDQKVQMIKDAESQATRIKAQAESKIEQEVAQAKDDIRAFLVSESTQMAETALKSAFGKDQQKAAMDDYLKKLEQTG